MKITIEGTREEIRKLCPNFSDLISVKMSIGNMKSEFRPTKMNIWDEDVNGQSSLILQQVIPFKTEEEIEAEWVVKIAEESLKKAKQALEAIRK